MYNVISVLFSPDSEPEKFFFGDISRSRKTIVYSMSYGKKVMLICKIDFFCIIFYIIILIIPKKSWPFQGYAAVMPQHKKSSWFQSFCAHIFSPQIYEFLKIKCGAMIFFTLGKG